MLVPAAANEAEQRNANHKSLARLPLKMFDNLTNSIPYDTKGEDGMSEIVIGDPVVHDCQSTNIASSLSGPFRSSPHDLKVWVCSKLLQWDIATVGQLLQQSPWSVVQMVSPALTLPECEELLQRICLWCAVKPRSAYQLYQAQQQGRTLNKGESSCNDHIQSLMNWCIPSGLPSLDGIVFRFSTITELVGPSAVGKSQWAIQLCALAALKSFYGSVYIHTEPHKLHNSISRLHEMSSYLSSDTTATCTSTTCNSPHSSSLESLVHNNVTIYQPNNLQSLISILTTQLEQDLLVPRNSIYSNNYNSTLSTTNDVLPVKLLIVDSLVALLHRNEQEQQKQLDKSQMKNRSLQFFQIGQLLKRLADEYDIACLVINPATDEGEQMETILGTSWYHCVTTRLFLQFVDNENSYYFANDDERNSKELQQPKRLVKVQKSNITGLSHVYFRITNQGLCELPL
jgi:RecA/RadA recombinase